MLNVARSHALAGACLAVGLIGAGTAEAAPRVTGVSLDRSAVTGREVKLRIRAVDPKAPVNGLVVTFGRPSESVGILDSVSGRLSLLLLLEQPR